MDFSSAANLIHSPSALPDWVVSSTLAISSPYVSTSILVLIPILLSCPVVFRLNRDIDRDGVAKNWHKFLRIYHVLHPYFIPPDAAAARTLVVNLFGVGICLVLGRAINLICPLLLRHIVDTLANGHLQRGNAASTAARVAATAKVQGDGLGDVPSVSFFSLGTFPWPQMVAYIFARHIIPRAVNHHERRCTKLVRREISKRMSLAAYRKLLSFGADYHENGGQSKKKEKEKEKEKNATSASEIPWSIVLYSAPWGADWVLHWAFSSAPSVVDLFVGLAAFWGIGGGLLAGTMTTMLILFVATSVAEILMRDEHGPKLREARNLRTSSVSDRLNNWQMVELFGTRDAEVDRFRDLSELQDRLEDQHSGLEARWGFSPGEVEPFLVEMGGLLILSLISGWQISQGLRSVGDFIMLTQYYRDLISPLNQIMWGFRSAGRELDRLMQVVDVLEREPAIKDDTSAPDLELDAGHIEFRDVGFTYPDAKGPALDGVSFSLKGGQMVAIVGETGGGKSTLLKLLVRAHDATSGSVLVDGQDVRSVRRSSLLSHIAVVPQVAGVLSATVLDNVRYGRESASEDEVEAACRAAHLHKKITSAFAEGYGEKVGMRGSTQLSGGEAQRLAIARALVRDAKIVIFDEAMSSLDSETEWKIQTHLREWFRGRTVVVVAHRLATVAQADLILAIKDGKIVESGTQSELLAKEGYYHNLWTKQKLVA